MPKREPKLVLHLELDGALDPAEVWRSLTIYRQVQMAEASVMDVLEADEWIVDDDQIVVSFRSGDGDNRPVQVTATARLVGAEITPEPAPARCGARLGKRPEWMSPGQYDPCECDLPAGHDPSPDDPSGHSCKHVRPHPTGEERDR